MRPNDAKSPAAPRAKITTASTPATLTIHENPLAAKAAEDTVHRTNKAVSHLAVAAIKTFALHAAAAQTRVQEKNPETETAAQPDPEDPAAKETATRAPIDRLAAKAATTKASGGSASVIAKYLAEDESLEVVTAAVTVTVNAVVVVELLLRNGT